MIKISIKIKSHSINSDRLFKAIVEEVNTAIRELKFDWSDDDQRQSFVDMLGEWISTTYEEPGKISQAHIIGDNRVNNNDDMKKGIYKIVIKYRQADCLNISRIVYTCTRTETK